MAIRAPDGANNVKSKLKLGFQDPDFFAWLDVLSGDKTRWVINGLNGDWEHRNKDEHHWVLCERK